MGNNLTNFMVHYPLQQKKESCYLKQIATTQQNIFNAESTFIQPCAVMFLVYQEPQPSRVTWLISVP